MDRMLEPEVCARVREECACVLSNSTSIYARTFRRLRKQQSDDDCYIDAVIEYLNGTRPLRRCGVVTREGDRIYSTIAEDSCECPVIREGLDSPISQTWCRCSVGSLLCVYREVFPERRCTMEIVETIAGGGARCRFVTTFE